MSLLFKIYCSPYSRSKVVLMYRYMWPVHFPCCSPSFIPSLSALDDIREYFGETIAMYFGFLGFYSMSLIPPVLLVVVFALSGAHEQTKNTVFAILNLIWGTVFLEAWKRRCSEISFNWGSLKAGIGELILIWAMVYYCMFTYHSGISPTTGIIR